MDETLNFYLPWVNQKQAFGATVAVTKKLKQLPFSIFFLQVFTLMFLSLTPLQEKFQCSNQGPALISLVRAKKKSKICHWTSESDIPLSDLISAWTGPRVLFLKHQQMHLLYIIFQLSYTDCFPILNGLKLRLLSKYPRLR